MNHLDIIHFMAPFLIVNPPPPPLKKKIIY